MHESDYINAVKTFIAAHPAACSVVLALVVGLLVGRCTA